MIINCSYTELRDIDILQPNPRNPNKHPQEQIKLLAKIMKHQGWRSPIVVSRRSGFIVRGHGRLMAAKMNGWTQCPVDLQEYATEADEYADMVADNKIAELAEVDLSMVSLDVKNFSDLDIELLGIPDFQPVSIESIEPLCDEDEVQEPKESIAKPGDIWRLGNHRLMCGDSTDPNNVSKLFGEEKAVVWLSDPPYGVNYVKNANSKDQALNYKPIANDEKERDEIKSIIYQSIAGSLPFMQKGFAFYMWHSLDFREYTSYPCKAALDAGIIFHRQIIWVKPNFVVGYGQYHCRHELCMMGWLKGDMPPFYGERNQNTVWEFSGENDKIHPTQKPVALWEPSILNHSKPMEIIYDPFCGSGSSLIACEKNNRRCFAMEIEPEYVDVIIHRWEKYTGKKAELLNG